jgi:hypothetical protein
MAILNAISMMEGRLRGEIEAIQQRQQRIEAELQRQTSNLTPASTAPASVAPPPVDEVPPPLTVAVDAAPEPQAGRARIRKALPFPEKFDGNRNKFPAWKQQMIDKLEIDADIIGGPREMWYAVNSCLGDAPKDAVSTYYASGATIEYPVRGFILYLEAIFGDPNRAERAARKLRTMRQGEFQNFATFFPKFEQTLSEAGGASWPPDAKLALLEGTLNERLRMALVSVDLPKDYNPWVNKVYEVSGRLEAVNANRPRSALATRSAAPRGRGAATDHEGDTRMTGVAAATSSKGTARQQRAKWVSEEEMKKRRDEGRCLRCGNQACRINRCPLLPATRPARAAAAITVAHASEVSGDEGTQSENE